MMELDYKAIIGAILGFAAVWLATRQNPFYWIISIFSVSIYSFVFFEKKLYSSALLHIIYLVFSIFGFYNWNRKKEGKSILKVSILSTKERSIWVAIIFVTSFLLGFLFHNFTDASAPYVDNFCTSASLVGTYWQSKKKIENWPLWVIVNTIYVCLYINRGLYVSSLLYFLYVMLAVVGWRKWLTFIRNNE